MNYDPSWRAGGERATDLAGVVAGRLPPGSDRIEFRYVPRTLAWSIPLFLVTLAACLFRRRHAASLRALFHRARRFPPLAKVFGSAGQPGDRP
jgi:hypothetical protein